MAYRSALITGASSGIGAAFAAVLPPTTDLVLTGRRAERLQRVATPLWTPSRRVDIVAADFTMANGRSAVIEKALAHDIDLFVCNAGVGRAGSFLETPLAVQQEGLGVNVLAVVELLHALLPPMIARARRRQTRAGVIIVSSMGAFSTAPGLAGYGAAKAFELHLARSLAVELEDEPIDVLALCPSYTDTAFFARAGLPPPRRTVAPEAVAREALHALGRRPIHLCSLHHFYPQGVRQLVAFNPLLAAWRWPRQLAAKLRHDPARHRPARRAQPAKAR